MWKSFVRLMWNIGRIMEEQDAKRSTYKPEYDGQWVDKAKSKWDEDWQWVEKVKTLRPYYINVFKSKDDYIIDVGIEPVLGAIQTLVCEDSREVELNIQYLTTYYEYLGNVVMPSEAG